VQAGEDYDAVQRKTKARDGGILDETGAALAKGAGIAKGQKLRIPGIRWTKTIAGETYQNVADQHGISVDDLLAANGLPKATKPGTVVGVGKRLLIPVQIG
jgi:hypothetical protein